MDIGYFGPAGSFTHEAAMRLFSKDDINLVERPTIEVLFEELSGGSLEKIVVPIENSVEGAVNVTMDMLSHVDDVLIENELAFKINQNLLIKKNADKSKIKYIYSHSQALAQCRGYLLKNWPTVEQRATLSTSAAAKLANEREDCLAIGSVAAAGIFNLEVLEAGIQDSSNNTTRFVVVSKKGASRSGRDKTSIVFSTDNRPGSLYQILDIFSLWDINLDRIESRPSKDMLGKYIFFVDLEGHEEDDDIRDALTMVKRKTSFYKFLGSYPRFVQNL